MNTQETVKAKVFGHLHTGIKTPEGYGLCSHCGARENTDSHAEGCLKEGYYLFSNPAVGISDKSRIFIQVDSDGKRWVDWCEPSIKASELNELLPGGVFEACN